MKGNYGIAFEGQGLTLVPYRKHHVEKYHQWMCSPELLEATASEPLSLQEEYEMQQTWRDDEAKCTFIILAGGRGYEGDEIEEERMVGDVNLFLHDRDDPTNAEIEIMVAEPKWRRKGLAKEALHIMMGYALKNLNITRFFAKIGTKNTASLSLFQGLGYTEVNYVEAFEEHELALHCKPGSDDDTRDRVMALVQEALEEVDYYSLKSTQEKWKNEVD
jgi:RimJ/RimL family protein N-acetyltransferase